MGSAEVAIEPLRVRERREQLQIVFRQQYYFEREHASLRRRDSVVSALLVDGSPMRCVTEVASFR